MSKPSEDSPRVASLRAKLKSRENVPGFEKNCEAIRAEIQRLTMGALDL
jgi:hypothetical protein